MGWTPQNELPAIGNLCNLQLLDCDRKMLHLLPEGMDKLTNLRLLNMPLGEFKESIDLGVFHELQRLEMLHLPMIRYTYSVGVTSFDEISHLPNLTSLFIYLDSSSISNLKSDHTWMKRLKRLKRFHITVGYITVLEELPFNKSTRAIYLLGFDIFNNKDSLSSMLQFASDLYLQNCMGLTKFIRNNSFDGLKSLCIKHWSCDFGQLEEGSDDPLPNLEHLRFFCVDHLKSVSNFGHFLGLRFSKLRKLDVFRCDNLTCLFNVGGAFSVPRHLEEISLLGCDHLTELLAQLGSSQTTFVSSEIPRVRRLRLDYSNTLRTFGEPESMWEHLEELEVIECNGIRKLPLSIQTSNNIKVIKGYSRWWSRLEWDDEKYKSNLENCFTEIQR